jgi:acyl-CoA thioester hydrolase
MIKSSVPEVVHPGDFPVLRRLSTRWGDNDVYGHLNNVVYYSLFDTAVNGWLIDACACDIRALPAIGVVVETSCRYLRETSFPDVLHIGIRLERRGTSSVVYRLAVFREHSPGQLDDDPHALGRFVHVYVDSETRKPVPVPEPIATALAMLAPPRPPQPASPTT